MHHEINSQKCRELAALQLKLSYCLGKLKSSVLQEESIFWMTRFDSVKENLNEFYQARAKINTASISGRRFIHNGIGDHLSL